LYCLRTHNTATYLPFFFGLGSVLNHALYLYNFSFLTHLPDLRLPSTVPLNFTKSISLSLSERGINAINGVGRPGLLEKTLAETLPMRGRMIHGKSATGDFYQQAQDYDIYGRVSYLYNSLCSD
jgi:hypothetical protein